MDAEDPVPRVDAAVVRQQDSVERQAGRVAGEGVDPEVVDAAQPEVRDRHFRK